MAIQIIFNHYNNYFGDVFVYDPQCVYNLHWVLYGLQYILCKNLKVMSYITKTSW